MHSDKQSTSSLDSTSSQLLEINSAYWYEDQDMLEILQKGIERLGINTESVQVLPPTDTVFANTLRTQLQFIDPRYRGFILIPQNLGGYHWVGIAMQITDTEITAEYTDPLGQTDPLAQMTIPSVVTHTLLVRFPTIQIQPTERLIQQDGSSCGPLVIENLLQMAKRENPVKTEVSDSRSIRQKHIEWLGGASHTLYERQRQNKNTVATLAEQLGYMNRLSQNQFSPKEYQRILDIVSILKALPPEASELIKTISAITSSHDNIRNQYQSIKAVLIQLVNGPVSPELVNQLTLLLTGLSREILPFRPQDKIEFIITFQEWLEIKKLLIGYQEDFESFAMKMQKQIEAREKPAMIRQPDKSLPTRPRIQGSYVFHALLNWRNYVDLCLISLVTLANVLMETQWPPLTFLLTSTLIGITYLFIHYKENNQVAEMVKCYKGESRKRVQAIWLSLKQKTWMPRLFVTVVFLITYILTSFFNKYWDLWESIPILQYLSVLSVVLATMTYPLIRKFEVGLMKHNLRNSPLTQADLNDQSSTKICLRQLLNTTQIQYERQIEDQRVYYTQIYERRLTEKEEELTQKKNEILRLISQVESIQKQIQQLSQEKADLMDKHQSETDRFNKEIITLNEKQKKSQTQNDGLKTENQSLQTLLQKTQGKQNELEAKIQSLNSRINELEAERVILKEKLQDISQTAVLPSIPTASPKGL